MNCFDVKISLDVVYIYALRHLQYSKRNHLLWFGHACFNYVVFFFCTGGGGCVWVGGGGGGSLYFINSIFIFLLIKHFVTPLVNENCSMNNVLLISLIINCNVMNKCMRKACAHRYFFQLSPWQASIT